MPRQPIDKARLYDVAGVRRIDKYRDNAEKVRGRHVGSGGRVSMADIGHAPDDSQTRTRHTPRRRVESTRR